MLATRVRCPTWLSTPYVEYASTHGASTAPQSSCSRGRTNSFTPGGRPTRALRTEGRGAALSRSESEHQGGTQQLLMPQLARHGRRTAACGRWVRSSCRRKRVWARQAPAWRQRPRSSAARRLPGGALPAQHNRGRTRAPSQAHRARPSRPLCMSCWSCGCAAADAVNAMAAAQRLETLAVHAGQSPDPTTNARAVPIYASTSFVRARAGLGLRQRRVPRRFHPAQSSSLY